MHDLLHSERYFSRVIVANTALPARRTTVQSSGFGVDGTPPITLAPPSFQFIYPFDVAAQSASGRIEPCMLMSILLVDASLFDFIRGSTQSFVQVKHAPLD